LRARSQNGSVVFDKRRGTWSYLWRVDGQRKSKLLGSKKELPTKKAAWQAAEPMRRQLLDSPGQFKPIGITVNALVRNYRVEKMPQRHSTKLGYEAWFRNHILPKWGDCLLTGVQARPVELWLKTLQLSPKSLSHIRGLLHLLWDYAQWRGEVEVQRNPMDLVTVKGATKRTRKPRSLTVEEFRKFASHLEEPFRTMALLCVSLGLRISECLALKWKDVDWLNGKLRVERGIVRQVVGDVKTSNSERTMSLDAELLGVLRTWHTASQFSAPDDWMFASPIKRGQLPWSYKQVWLGYRKAAVAAALMVSARTA
jgi:integrase